MIIILLIFFRPSDALYFIIIRVLKKKYEIDTMKFVHGTFKELCLKIKLYFKTIQLYILNYRGIEHPGIGDDWREGKSGKLDVGNPPLPPLIPLIFLVGWSLSSKHRP